MVPKVMTPAERHGECAPGTDITGSLARYITSNGASPAWYT